MKSKLLPANLGNAFFTARRVFQSRNRIGLFHLFLYALSIPVTPLDWLFAVWQRSWIKKTALPASPIIFISGYSRSGTTPIYQSLVKVWDIEYINNLTVLFPRSYPLANFFFRKFSAARDDACESFYGRTRGLAGTNDGAQLFQRWFSGEVLAAEGPLPDEAAADLQDFARLHEYLLQKPLLLKNCNAYLKFPQIRDMFPNSRFIFVKRDPKKIVDSTLRAREFIQGSRSEGWEFSLHGCQNGGTGIDPILEICLNVRHGYDKIEAFSKTLPANRLEIIHYEEFCQAPVPIIQEMTHKFFGADIAENHIRQSMPNLEPDMELKSPVEEQARIREVVKSIFPGI